MPAPFKICTEADYLQAHITVLGNVPRAGHPALNRVKDHLASALKKWMLWDGLNAARGNSLSSLKGTKLYKLF